MTRDAPSATGNRRLQIAGVSVTPEVAAIALVYFVQGILGLSRLAKEFFVKDELGLDPAAASLIFTVSSFPWLVKPLWGFVSDAVPLFGTAGSRTSRSAASSGRSGRRAGDRGGRRPLRGGRLHARVAQHGVRGRRHRRRRRARARGGVARRGGRAAVAVLGLGGFRGILSAYYSGSLIETNGTRFVFGVTAMFPLLIACAAAALVREDRARRRRRNKRK